MIRRWIAVVPALVVYTLLRVPSFFEPHWYTDEAGYLTTARALLRGRVLYAGIWNNKPPLQLWTVAVVVRLFGTSEVALHAVTFAAGLIALAGVAYAALRLMPPRLAAVAVIAYAILIGLPIFDAELLIPESLLIAPMTWTGVLVVLRTAGIRPGPHSWRWAVLAGGLAAAGIAYQQSEVVEAAALGLLLLLSPRLPRREFVAYAATVAGITLAWLLAAVLVAGFGKVEFALAGFYTDYRQVPSDPLLRYGLDGLQLVGAALIVAAAFLLRRRRGAWVIWIWAGAALLVPAAAQEPYPHLLLPAMAPLVLGAFTLLRPRLPVKRGSLRSAGVAAAAIGMLVTGFFAGRSGLDWIPNLAGAPWMNNYRNFNIYYVNFAQVALGRSNLDSWQDQFDERVPADTEVAEWIRSHKLQGDKLVVWSSDAWPYVLSNSDVQLPTAPLYNNFILLGEQGQVTQYVRQLDPEVIVTSDQELAEYPQIQPYLKADFRVTFRYAPDEIWVRDDVVGTLASTHPPAIQLLAAVPHGYDR